MRLGWRPWRIISNHSKPLTRRHHSALLVSRPIGVFTVEFEQIEITAEAGYSESRPSASPSSRENPINLYFVVSLTLEAVGRIFLCIVQPAWCSIHVKATNDNAEQIDFISNVRTHLNRTEQKGLIQKIYFYSHNFRPYQTLISKAKPTKTRQPSTKLLL